MSATTGDKSRHNRQRRKKLARRVEARALRTTLDAQGSTAQAKSAPKKKGTGAARRRAPAVAPTSA